MADVPRDSKTGFPLVQPGSINAADLAKQAGAPTPSGPATTPTTAADAASGQSSATAASREMAAQTIKLAPVDTRLTLFQERQHDDYYIDFMVFVAGVDVTPWIQGSLTYTYSSRNGWNTVNFTLSNAEDIFILDHKQALDARLCLLTGFSHGLNEDLYRIPAPDGDHRYSETAKLDIIRNKVESRLNVQDPDTGAFRWELHPNGTCFNKHDPIRVFVRHPLIADEGPDVEAWLPAFTGYLENRPFHDNGINGEKTVTVTGFDIRAFLKLQRVSTNWSAGQMAGNRFFEIGDEIFNDIRAGNRYGQPLPGTKFEDAVLLLTTGRTRNQKAKRRFAGIGNYGLGAVYELPLLQGGPTKPAEVQKVLAAAAAQEKPPVDVPTEMSAAQKSVLETWYKQALFGEWKLSTGTVTGRPLTLKEAKEVGKATWWDQQHAPDTRKVYILVPKGGTGNKNFVDTSSGQTTAAHDTTWTTRLDVIQAFCAGIDYQFWVSGAGDMFFTWNMCDMQPDDFGSYLADTMKVDQQFIDSTISDESGQIPSVITATGGHGLTNIRADSRLIIRRAQAWNKLFIRRYGIAVQSRSYPFVGSTSTLRALAAVDLQKAVANANTIDVKFAFRPFLIINTPFLHVPRTRMGTIDSVTQTIPVFGEPTTRLRLTHGRWRRADGRYVLITGGTDAVINGKRVLPLDRPHGDPSTGLSTDEDLEKDRSVGMKDPPESHNKLPDDIKQNNFKDSGDTLK